MTDVVWRGPDALRHLLVPINTLQPDPSNANQHPPDNLDAIHNSLGLYGQQKPIVVSPSGTIVAGNGLWVAAHRPIPVYDPATGEAIEMQDWTHIAVVPSDLTPAEMVGYGIADNRTGELAEWDLDQLASNLGELVEDGVQPAMLGFDDKALADLLGDSWGRGDSEQPDEDDEAPPVAEDAVSSPGDVWLLGPHRLVCGDAVDDLDLAIADRKVGCVLTDPPYGIDLDTDWSDVGGSGKAMMQGVPGGNYRRVEGDDEPYDARPLRLKLATVKEQFWFGADYYRRTLSDDDLDGSWLVWDKRTESRIGSGFELIWSQQRHKRDLLRVWWFGAFGDAEARNRLHPTQKPTRLLATILERWAPSGCLVVDPYAGSGSTIIACHRTGRVAAAVEVDPLYVDVICRRWQHVTGDKPILEATGEPYDFGEVG